MSKKDNYEAPQVKELGGDAGEEIVDPVKPLSPTLENAPKPQPEAVIPMRLGIGDYLSAKGDVASDLLVGRIAQHIKYIIGKEGFADNAAKATEQGTFIDLILGSLELPFEQFVVVTDYFITVVRENGEKTDGTQLRRFMTGLDPKFDVHKAKVYAEYITFLTRIAKNWARRHKLAKLIDCTYAIRDLSPKGKENVSLYFSKLVSV